VVHHGYPHSSDGYAVRTQGVAKALSDQGCDVLVASRLPIHDKCLGSDSLKWESHLIEGVKYRILHNKECMQIDFLSQMVEIHRADAIVAASDWRNARPAQNVARNFRLPFFYEVRGFWEISKAARDPAWKNSTAFQDEVARETEMACAADRVFTINRLMSAELQKRGVKPDKIALVPNAVTRYSADATREKPTREGLGISSRFIVGYIGSFNKYEGLEDAIESLARVLQNGLDVSMLLVGSSASSNFSKGEASDCVLSKDYRDLAAKRGIASKVKLVGRVPASDAGGYYDLLDLVLIPRRPFEVCELVSPMKPLEAASHGKRVLMSNVAPLLDLSQQNHLFHYFEKGSVDSLAKRMEEILRTPQTEPQKAKPVTSWRESVRPIL
jgi:glycosyltransferase involved in cell wall biosynthesis